MSRACEGNSFVREVHFMRKRRRPIDDPEVLADADSSLRSMSRLFPHVLARMIVRPGERIRRMEWGETQLAARQRRVDRLLHIEMEDAACRVLHLEWTVRLNRGVLERMAEYHIMLAKQLGHDARLREKRGEGSFVELTVESVAVVLTGRKRVWPEHMEVRTTPKDKRFSGVTFQIEAVYQRTVVELEAKDSVFWLAFVPLAVDADEEKIRRVVDKVRSETNEEEFSEIVATMMSMAQLKSARPGLVEVIRSAQKEKMNVRHPWYQDGHAEGQQKGLSPLLYLFERRLGRSLKESERRRITARLNKEGPEKLGAAVLDLTREELAAWLAPRKLRAA